MKKCLVSLISDQTIPNILIALHFKPDFMLFISTPAMEKKGKSGAILDTLKFRHLDFTHNSHTLEVDENSILDLQNQVSRWLEQAPEDLQFIVNLTCGTKLMSIGAYDLFTDFDSTMVYVPIPRNEFLVPFPKRRPKQPVPLPDRLSVEEYLTAYGINIANKSKLPALKDEALARRELTCFIFANYTELLPLLQWFGDRLRPLKRNEVKKGCDFCDQFSPTNGCQEHLLRRLNFQIDQGRISTIMTESLWNYLRGGWLEERLFLAVQDAIPQVTDLQLSIQFLDRQGNNNEIDVMFTRENVLYLVECKSLEARESGEMVGGTITDFLYKLGALRQQFGLTPKAFLATTAESIYEHQGQIKEHLINRAAQFNCEIIPLSKIPDLETYLQSRF